MSTLRSDITKLSGRIIRDYKLSSLLGAGAFGAVYLAKSSNATVAVKCSTDMNSAIEEAQILTTLKGTEHVPQFISSGIEGDIHVIIMSQGFMDLDALRIRNIQSNHKFSKQNIQKILYQSVTALEGIHAKKVVHRDIKPNNMMVTHPEGQTMTVKLLLIDFGWGCRFGDECGNGSARSSSRLRHCSARVQQGASGLPLDDLCQLTYASILLTGATIAGLFLSDEDRLEYKQGLMTRPELFLTRLADWLLPFFSIIGSQDPSMPMNYDAIRTAIQELLPSENAAGELRLIDDAGVLKLP